MLKLSSRHFPFNARFMRINITAEADRDGSCLLVAPTPERVIHTIGTRAAADAASGLVLVAVDLVGRGLRYLRIRVRPLRDTERRIDQDFDLQENIALPPMARGTAILPTFATISGAGRRRLTMGSVWPGSTEMEIWLMLVDEPGNATGIWTGEAERMIALYAIDVNVP